MVAQGMGDLDALRAMEQGMDIHGAPSLISE